MIRCHNCRTDNLDGSEYCDECGVRLHATPEGPAPVPTPPPMPALPPTRSDPVVEHREQFVTGSDLTPTEHLDQRASGTVSLRNSPPTGSAAKPHAKLVISRGGSIGKEFPVVGPEAQIGRWDADNGIFPDIDLDQHDSEAKVSRRHARIIAEAGQYMVEDLGSTNGTFINRGRRLIPGKRQPLRSGDELIIGKTFLKFIIEN